MVGFNPTFYAGRPKLSEVAIDSDLNMGGRNIRRVGRIESPYMPGTWPTEELDWGDGDPSDPVVVASSVGIAPGTPQNQTVFTAVERTEIAVTVSNVGSSGNGYNSPIRCYVRVNGNNFAECLLEKQQSHTVTVIVSTDETVSVYLETTDSTIGTTYSISYMHTGRVVGEKIFDLSGKWLALGIDMHSVPATVVIQGVEMPYADYMKYFPLAPTELKFPADWENGRTRPIVEVYK